MDEPGVASIGAQAQATVDIGAMKSVMVGGHAAANATGSITLSGVEQVKDIPGQRYCFTLGTNGRCLDWEFYDDTFIYDNGTVAVSVNGQLFSYAYSSGDTVSSIANSLAGTIRASSSTADYASVVINTSATPPTATIFLTARNANAAGNSITLSLSATSYNTATFAAASFNPSASGAALTGGIDFYAGTQVTDSGTVTISVGSFASPAISYGVSTANNTAAQVAAALVTALAGSGFTATLTPGSTVLTIKDTSSRASSNGAAVQVHSVTSDAGDFPVASFSASGTLSGGADQVWTALGNVTLYQWDGLGNMLCVEQHGGVTGTGCSSLPANDATSPWRVRRFTYDSLSRILTAHNPESGTIAYSYDNDGELLQKTSPAPNQTGSLTQTVSYCYDALHRMTGKGYGAQSCPLAAPVVSYTYDSGANAIGKLSSLTDQAGSASYSYDSLGRLVTETRPIAGISKSTSYSYNLDGSVKALTYPSGRVVTYTPDSAGRLLSAVDGNGTNYVSSANYNPDGSLKGLVNGSTPALTSSFQYTHRLQLCRMTTITAGTMPISCGDTNIGNVMDRGYNFNDGAGDNGNVMSITNYRDANRSQAFTYDALNRLTSGWSSANTGAYSWGENYSIDAWGNLQISPMGGKAHGGYFPNGSDVTNRAVGLGYDAAGNMTNYTAPGQYVYDQENRLSSTAGMSYTYDGSGERVMKSNSTTGATLKRYWSSAGNVLAEDDGTGNLTAEYVYFNGKRVARVDLPAGSVHYYLSDHLKSTSMVVSTAGTVEEESDYSSFGTEYPITGAGVNRYKFTGKEYDAESGLADFGARYDSSSLGRFMTADPSNIGVDRHNPQSWNAYSYSLNNPLNITDPTGLYVCEDSTKCDSKNDQAFAKSLADAQTAANKLTGDDQASAQRAIDAYGAQGVDNGVNVRFDGNITSGTGVTEVSGVANGNKSADNPTGQNINVTFNPDAVGKDQSAGLVAHEGSHVADGSDWVKSGFSANMDSTHNQTEMNANHVQFNIMNAQLGALYPNGYTAGLYNNSVKWNKGDTFKVITPDLQKAIQKANGADDTKPAFTKGWRLQP